MRIGALGPVVYNGGYGYHEDSASESACHPKCKPETSKP